MGSTRSDGPHPDGHGLDYPANERLISAVVAELAPIDIVARLDRSDLLVLRLRMLAPDLVLIGLTAVKATALRAYCATHCRGQR